MKKLEKNQIKRMIRDINYSYYEIKMRDIDYNLDNQDIINEIEIDFSKNLLNLYNQYLDLDNLKNYLDKNQYLDIIQELINNHLDFFDIFSDNDFYYEFEFDKNYDIEDLMKFLNEKIEI